MESADASCAHLSETTWPATRGERGQLINRLNAARDRCKNHASFLALLGGLWLEEGDAEQALLWLERALLLEPGHLGAQVDHALALAAQGDLSARNELLKAWEGRPDVPPLVMARLRATAGQGAGGAARGNGSPGRWVHAREATWVLGHESNLNHSPRLSELTLTFPDETVVLPLPQQPRSGQAQLLDLSWQSGYAIRPGLLIQGGFQAVGRHADRHPDTDWHSAQAGLALVARLNGWRATAQWTGTWFGGELSQPYRAQRSTLILESVNGRCQHRLSLDFERRTQAGGDFLNTGEAVGLGWSGLCPVGLGDWNVGLAVRGADDRPLDDQRVGGRQRQASVGLRAFGSLSRDLRIDLNLRHARAHDDDGYSELLENNARRKLAPTSLSIELTRSLESPLGQGGLELVAQLQAVRQTSNIPLFRYSAFSVLLGPRLRW